jgi:hypothetical protein
MRCYSARIKLRPNGVALSLVYSSARLASHSKLLIIGDSTPKHPRYFLQGNQADSRHLELQERPASSDNCSMERTARSKAQTFAIQALLFPIISIVVFVIEIQSSNDLLIVQVASVVLVSAISFILAVAALSRCQIEEKRVMLPSIIGLVVSGCLLCIFIVAMCVGIHQNAAHRARPADTQRTH